MQAHELRQARLRLGLTQAALAQRLDLSRQWVVEMEAGRATITPRTALAIRELLNEKIRAE